MFDRCVLLFLSFDRLILIFIDKNMSRDTFPVFSHELQSKIRTRSKRKWHENEISSERLAVNDNDHRFLVFPMSIDRVLLSVVYKSSMRKLLFYYHLDNHFLRKESEDKRD
jgi:hypothetical protein